MQKCVRMALDNVDSLANDCTASRPPYLTYKLSLYSARPLTRNTQTVIGNTNLCNKYGGPWTLAILALPDNLTFDLTHLIRMHIDGKI